MWRIAHCLYRAFRNTATHRCPQDILVPLTTIRTTEDDTNQEDEQEKSTRVTRNDIIQVIKNNQFTYPNIEKLQEHLKSLSLQLLTKKIKLLESAKAKPVTNDIPSTAPESKREETLETVIQADENCTRAIQDLADLHEETMSVINLQLAVEALESGDFQFGIETLENCAKNGTNAAALYNLGICYERGIGVEQDRAKACDYYRQASTLGHPNAQMNLTLLSNQIDLPDNDEQEETTEQTITTSTSDKSKSSLRELFFRFLLSTDDQEEPSFHDDPFDLKNQSIVCLS